MGYRVATFDEYYRYDDADSMAVDNGVLFILQYTNQVKADGSPRHRTIAAFSRWESVEDTDHITEPLPAEGD